MKTLPLISLLALAACGADTFEAPELGVDEELTLDKELAQADEIAAIVSTRAVLDAMVDRRLLAAQPNPEDAHGLGSRCADSEPSIAWRETDCAGLEGWGLETRWSGCEIDDVGVVEGSLFVSFADVLASLPLELDPADAEAQLRAMTEGRGPELVSRYHVELQGVDGGNLSACGTASGPSEDSFSREVIDVDIDGHEARIIWDAATSRSGVALDAIDISHASVQAQFPRGALVDPYRFEVTNFERHVSSPVASGGVMIQHGWQGDVVGFIDAETAETGNIHIEHPNGMEIAEIPRF